MDRYEENATAETEVDDRERLVARFIQCDRALQSARRECDQLRAEIEERSAEVSRLREQIGDAFGITDHATQRPAAF